MRACPQCREPLPDDATFCYRCRWREAEAAPEPQPHHEPVPAAETGPAWERAPAHVPEPPRATHPIAREVATTAPPASPAREPDARFMFDGVLAPVDAAEERPKRNRRPTSPMPLTREWLAISVLTLALTITIGALIRTQVEPAAPAGTIVATAPIGRAGGSLPFARGARLEIPPQAVRDQTVFTVSRFVDGDGQAPALITVGGASYAFGPDDIVFAVPVTIVFPLPSGPVPEVIVERGDDQETVRATVDREAETISVRTRSFADLVIAAS